MYHHFDLEEDYETVHKDGCRPDPYGGPDIPVGRCSEAMCSDTERLEREASSRLNRYEIKEGSNPPQSDKTLVLKEYKRSCAGREFTHSFELRPWSSLRRALHHLLFNICLKKDDWMYICDFVFDRLKAVRQDMVIQRIEGRRYVEVLEGSVRFLVYSMYRLTCTLVDYTKIRPFKTIITSTGRVSGLNNYELHVVREMKLTMTSLRDCLNSLIIQYQENVPDSPNRPLFEAVNLIVNLPFMHGHTCGATKFQSDSELRNSDQAFKTVFKMYREHLTGAHWTALKYLPTLVEYPLLVLAYAPVIAYLQVHMVQLLKKMYSTSGSNRSSVKHLCALICQDWLESDEDERLIFGKFVAIQFGFYDAKSKLCDYKLRTPTETSLPRDFVEKAEMERQKGNKLETDADNETRIYALQMILGKNWSFYQDIVQLHGLKYILDPSQN